MENKNTIDKINEVLWHNEISEYMQDEELTKSLELVVKLIAKPDIAPSVATPLIVQLQAYSTKFGMLASWYTNVKKDERAKKNIYYSAADRIDKLVDSLKYAARGYYG